MICDFVVSLLVAIFYVFPSRHLFYCYNKVLILYRLFFRTRFTVWEFHWRRGPVSLRLGESRARSVPGLERATRRIFASPGAVVGRWRDVSVCTGTEETLKRFHFSIIISSLFFFGWKHATRFFFFWRGNNKLFACALWAKFFFYLLRNHHGCGHAQIAC